MIAIEQVEFLRVKLYLHKGDVAYLLNVARPTYDKWIAEKARPNSENRNRILVVALGMIRALKSNKYDIILNSTSLRKATKRAKIVELIEELV